jgi:hypothetical protein
MSLLMPARSRFGVWNFSTCDGFEVSAASNKPSGASSTAARAGRRKTACQADLEGVQATLCACSIVRSFGIILLYGYRDLSETKLDDSPSNDASTSACRPKNRACGDQGLWIEAFRNMAGSSRPTGS